MDDLLKAKLFAAGKIALGAGRVASALATATGHGLLGATLGQHHMMHTAMRLGAEAGKAGRRQFDQGVADWKKANS